MHLWSEQHQYPQTFVQVAYLAVGRLLRVCSPSTPTRLSLHIDVSRQGRGSLQGPECAKTIRIFLYQNKVSWISEFLMSACQHKVMMVSTDTPPLLQIASLPAITPKPISILISNTFFPRKRWLPGYPAPDGLHFNDF